jgi:ribosomal protein S6E (S10)
VLSAVNDLYGEAIKTGQSVSLNSQTSNDSYVNFILIPGGYVKGIITNKEGQPIEGVKIVIKSERIHFEKTGITDASGKYMISGLAGYDPNKNRVNDYIVEMQAAGYPKQSQGQISIGQEVNFICTNGVYNQISGRITDSADAVVPKGEIVII